MRFYDSIESTDNNAGNDNTSQNDEGGAPAATSAMEDDSVVSSELKALRQSSIGMAASQKEGATQIVKDWISDGASKENSESNADDEGSE